MKIVYVILHYNVFEMTCSCIDSVLNIKNSDSEIVVVDNFSQNNSGSLLKEKYGANSSVHVLINNKNEGFAKGNNIGYDFARRKLEAEIIIDINNDIIIEQNDFEEIIEDICQKEKNVGIIAPQIINRKGINQNPFRVKKLSTLRRVKNLISYSVYYVSILTKVFYKKLYVHFHTSNPKECNEKEMFGIVPHGSCVIFTPSYVKKSEYAFVPITYFYGEEDILFDYVTSLKLNTFYTNALCVKHLEKVATNSLPEGERLREKRLTRSRILSIYKNIVYRIKLKIKK